jgi:hypothetical protein
MIIFIRRISGTLPIRFCGQLFTAYGNKWEIKGVTRDFKLAYLGRYHTIDWGLAMLTT